MAESGQGRRDYAASATAYLPAAVALVIILVAGIVGERQSRALADQAERATVRARIETAATELQHAVEAEAALAERLAGALAVASPAGAAGVEALAAPLLAAAGSSRTLGARIGGATTMLPEGGDAGEALAAVLGAELPGPRGARLAGPGDGHLVVWARIDDAEPSRDRAAVAVPVAAIFAAVPSAAEGLRLGLSGDGAGAVGPLGNADFGDEDPVQVPMAMAGAGWMLQAVPEGGWGGRPAAIWPIRLLTLLAVGLIVGPMVRTRRLIGERQRNIHDLRDREAELERLSRRLGLALDASKVGVWDFDLDTNVLVWDDRMDELYGYEATGRRHTYADWRDRLHPDDLARAEAEFREAIMVTGRYVSDYRLTLPGGAVRHIRAIGAVCREGDGSSKIVGVNWDVTADVARSEELNAKRLEAESASIAKSQFLATMSHEIRTPMNGVIGMLDLILRTDLDPVQRERAGIACDSARQLLAILNDILDLSKLEANGITLDRGPVDVRRLTRDVVALMATGADDRAIEVRAGIAADVPEMLLCDATRLRQVLMNLVGNAVKFTEKGCVEAMLGYDRRRQRLEVAIRDTGVGIPEEAKRHLFQRFAQVDSSITRERGGSGLGLAISRQLVELMGGEISVESVPALGSTFRFWVAAPPAPAAADVAAEAAPAAAPAVPAVPPARVLVAEDNPTNRQILGAYLAMAGHSAHMVTNGAEAMTALIDGGFDLLIMDVQMPVMDGLTAAGRIRASGGPQAAIPIIALTANAMQGDRERCLQAGMTDYVAKPVAMEALYGAMARSLGYSGSASTGDQPSPGSKLSMAPATASVSSPRSAS